MSKPAARLTDMHTCPMVTPGTPPVPHVGGMITGPGVPTVLIGNMPAATVGDMCICIGPPDTIAMGSTGVLICGKPAARMGDTTAHGGIVASGFPTVLIGETSGGGGGGAGNVGNEGDALQKEASGQSFAGGPLSKGNDNPKFSISEHGDINPLMIGPITLALKDAAKKGNAFCEVCQKSDSEMSAEQKANQDLSEQLSNKDWETEGMLRKQAAINGTPLMESGCPIDENQKQAFENLEDRRLASSPEMLNQLGKQLGMSAKNGTPFVTVCDNL